MAEALFGDYQFGSEEKALLDRDGHLIFPGLLTASTCERLIVALRNVIRQGAGACVSRSAQRYPGDALAQS